MNDRVMKFRVGVVVIATVLITGILVVAFSDLGTIAQGTYPLFVRFEDAPGIAEGTPVRKNGILIGRVHKTDFAEDGDGVVVTLRIQDKVKLKQDETPRIKTSFMGDAMVEFVSPPEKPKTTKLIEPGEYIDGTVLGNPLESFGGLQDELGTTARSLTGAGDEIRKLAASINQTMDGDDKRVQRILNKLEDSLDSFTRTTQNINGLIGDNEVQQELRRTVVELPKLFDQSRQMLDKMQVTVESANANLKNMEGLTKPLGDSGAQLVGKIDSTVTKLDELLAQFVMFGKQLNEEDGSLGRLVKDPELYQNLNKAAINIQKLTCDLRPIVHDAQVFSDKIARHPEQLGVRGAIRPSSGIK